MKTICALTTGLLIASLVGCGGARVNLVQTGALSAGMLPTPKVYVSSLNAYQQGDELVVSGTVKPRFDQSTNVDGHVDVAIFDAGRNVLHRASASYHPVNLFRSGRGHRPSAFSVGFPSTSNDGSKVYAAFHDAVLVAGATASDCGRNAALRELDAKSRLLN